MDSTKPEPSPQRAAQPAHAPAPARRVRVLLINPRFPESFWSFRWALSRVLGGKRALNPPLGLATLAALCPSHWDIEIIDENVEPVPLAPRADMVGVCGMAVQFHRQRELLRYYRRRGYHVVAGGSYASLCPEQYETMADTVVAGEAEYIWPAFCCDFEGGSPRPLYLETGVVDLADSPVPRFDLLKLEHYNTVSMQFSRGCPYRCDFCDIIVMFGRRPRTKSPQQIGEELDRLRSLGARKVFFVDDNLIGDKAKAKALLAYLAEYQRRHEYSFQFGTEASLNLAEDERLLALFGEANFAWVFIGIESPDADSLKETKKSQNARQDMLSAVRKIYRNGIDVLAGFIIGFDNDTMESFERQYRFIKASGIQVAMIGLLKALPRTPLYARLEREGRLLHDADHADNTRPGTNFMPKQMGYGEMVAGYRRLYRRLWRDRNIADRIRNKTRFLKHSSDVATYSMRESLRIAGRLCLRGLLPGGPRRWYHFLRTLGGSVPRAWPLAISDWIVALAMRDYIERYLGLDPEKERRLGQATLKSIRRKCAPCLDRGALEISVQPMDSGIHLAVTLRGLVDPRFFTKGARRLETLLRKSAATVSLRIEALAETQRHQLDALLARLAGYGDRVSIRVSEKLLTLIPIDSSVFHLVLEESVPRSLREQQAGAL